MDFWIAVIRLARTPRVIVPTLMVALTVGASVFLAVPPAYVASTTMVLATTEFGGTEPLGSETPTELVNPMLTFSDSLRTSADMLIWSMTSKDVKAELEHEGRLDVTVNDGRTNPELLSFTGPIVFVSAKGTDRSLAEEAVVAATELMRTRLRDWQDQMNAPASTYITLVDVVPPTTATPEHGYRLKLAIVAFAGAYLLGMSLGYGWTRLGARRTGSTRSGRGTGRKAKARGTPERSPRSGQAPGPDGSRSPAQSKAPVGVGPG